MIFGYRQYTPTTKLETISGRITTSVLLGATGTQWNNKQLSYQCSTGFYELRQRGPRYSSLFDCVNNQHGCGIYIVKNESQFYEPEAITARVIGWGDTVHYTQGWRVSECEIDFLIVPFYHSQDMCSSLETRYDAEVICDPKQHVTPPIFFGSIVRNFVAGGLQRPNDVDAIISKEDFACGLSSWHTPRTNSYFGTAINTSNKIAHGTAYYLYTGKLDLTVVKSTKIEDIIPMFSNLDVTANGIILINGMLVEVVSGAVNDAQNHVFRWAGDPETIHWHRLTKLRSQFKGWTNYPSESEWHRLIRSARHRIH